MMKTATDGPMAEIIPARKALTQSLLEIPILTAVANARRVYRTAWQSTSSTSGKQDSHMIGLFAIDR